MVKLKKKNQYFDVDENSVIKIENKSNVAIEVLVTLNSCLTYYLEPASLEIFNFKDICYIGDAVNKIAVNYHVCQDVAGAEADCFIEVK